MIAFPFVYFSCLLLWNIHKRGFDIYAYIVLIYTLSSFFSIFVDAMNLYSVYDIFKHPLGILAPLSYCLLLTICFEPFKKFRSNQIKKVTFINIKHYDLIVYISFALFIITIILSITRISDIIMNNALADIREDYSKGRAESMWSNYSGILRYVVALTAIISPCSVILILIFFINLAFLKKSFWFNLMTILGSLSKLIHSIYIADRSGFIQYILILGLCFVLTRAHIPNKTLKKVYVCGIGIISLLVLYLSAVTISRFGGQDGSDTNSVYSSLIYYAGSCYIQYCNFFNCLDIDAPFSLVPILPFTYWIQGLPDYFEQADIVEKYYHHGVSNFSTFLGMIMSMSGKIVMIAFVFIYYYIASKVVYRKNRQTITIKKLIQFFIVVLIVVNGITGYYYMSFSSVFIILIWLILGRWLKLKTK